MDTNIYKEKARENLKIAELAFGESCFNASVSRAYYSIFHGAIAILVEQGLLSAKRRVSHQWVQANFASKIITQKKLFESKFKAYLHSTHETRIKGDYLPQQITKKEARRALSKAQEFIQVIFG